MIRRTMRFRAPPDERVVDGGEYVLDRGEIVTSSPITTGNLWVTHFVAAKTETIMSIQTNTGGSGTVAVDADNAWVGVFDWDGTQYTPNVVSVDDPTRWTAEYQAYDTEIFAALGNGTADLGEPGFHKVAGREYGWWQLWIGGGQPPSLPTGGGNYLDSTVEPRTNAWMGTQTAPPAAVYQGAWFAPDSRRIQGYMKR
jgi:hypothetical protein